jgi:hypothetical protein
MFFYIDRMYLNTMSKLINKKDKRAIRKWCKINNLEIFNDSSGDFVYKNDFDLAYDMPLINNLKKKYGETWHDYYEAYKNNELHKHLFFTNDSKKKNYSPKGNISQKFCAGL